MKSAVCCKTEWAPCPCAPCLWTCAAITAASDPCDKFTLPALFPCVFCGEKKALCLSSLDTDAIILTQTIPVFLFQHSMSYVRSGFQCQKSNMEGETASGFTISTLGLRQQRFWMGERSPIQSHCVHTK